LFFKRLLLQKPEARFLFITPDQPQLILQAAAALNIPVSKFIIQKAERKEVPLLLAQSHVSIFFIKPCFSKKASSPTKMGEILSMGIPVICNAGVGDTDYLVEKFATGYLLKELNEDSYDQAIEKLDELLSIPAQQLRQVALTYFDLQKGVDLYDEVYQKLC
jgi:glycosyltransferase involved in cell wall biosynthesis